MGGGSAATFTSVYVRLVVPCLGVLCRAVLCRAVQEHQLYPCVGMRTKHEEVRANFGGAPFCVDLNRLHVSP